MTKDQSEMALAAGGCILMMIGGGIAWGLGGIFFATGLWLTMGAAVSEICKVVREDSHEL